MVHDVVDPLAVRVLFQQALMGEGVVRSVTSLSTFTTTRGFFPGILERCDLSNKSVRHVSGFSIEITAIDGQVSRAGGQLDPLGTFYGVDNTVAEIDVVKSIILGVIVGHVDVDIKAFELELANAQTFASEPITMKYFVRVT